MAADLIIGSLDSEIWAYLAAICNRHGLNLPDAYVANASDSILISMLNVASFDAFNGYAAGLEGFQGPDAMTKTTFRNLPWWLESFWLPLDFGKPIIDNGVFVGSSFRLREELERIKNLSAFDVDTVPLEYADMRQDYRAWFKAAMRKHEALSHDDTLRWIWNALHEGAGISIERNVPVTLAP